MRTHAVLSACATFALLACTSENGPTEPGASGTMAAADAPMAGAVNVWRERDPHRFGTVIGAAVGVLANPAGQSVVYGFGGCDVVQASGAHCTVSGVSIYSPATETWSFDNAPEAAVWKSNGVGAIGGKLYLSGGLTTHDPADGLTRRVWAYDPVARQATRLGDMPKATAEGVTGVIDGKLYVLPGICDANRYPQPGYCKQEPFRRLYRYDPVRNKWGARRSAPHFHRSGAAGVIGGKLYVVGGFRGAQSVADLDVYDPATDSWTTRAPMPTAGGAIGTALEGKLYVLAGTNAYVYDPGTNTWKSIAKPASGHDGVVRVVINGKAKLLAIGGLGGPNFDQPSNTEVYTP